MPLSLSLDTGIRPTTTRMSFDRDDNKSSRRRERPAHTAAATMTTITPLPRLVRTTKVPDAQADLGTLKSATRTPRTVPGAPSLRVAHQEMRQDGAARERLVETVVFAFAFAFNFLAFAWRGNALREYYQGLFLWPLPVASRLKTQAVSSVVCDEEEDDVRSSASSSSWYPLPAEPPPPYQLRVANPEPECGCSLEGEGGTGTADRDAGHRSAAAATVVVSFHYCLHRGCPCARLAGPSVPFPETVDRFRLWIYSEPHVGIVREKSRRETCAQTRDTIKFARRVTMSSGLPSVEPPIIRPL